MNSILIIDDEPSILTALEFSLNDTYKVFASTHPPDALAILEHTDIDLILLDQRLGAYDGMDILIEIKSKYAQVPVIAMTAYGSIEDSVKAMQNGAYHYVTKPLDLPALRSIIGKALEYRILLDQVEYLTRQLNDKHSSSVIIGKNKQMLNIIDLVDRIKNLDINVLISGESGTGKEVIAKAIHYSGERAGKPFQAINCAAIPYNLLESELFGYEKGAFTGAVQTRKGKLELAQGGDIFLDEIGDMEIGLQAKLLRVIQDKKVIRLGSDKEIDLNVRFIAATNKDLKESIQNGSFREDLFYRLNVISLHMPALRERKEDIPGFLLHFLNEYNEKFCKNVKYISQEASAILLNYDYPGNIRELENFMERAVALSNSDTLDVTELPIEMTRKIPVQTGDYFIVYVGESLRQTEKKLILKTLDHYGGSKKQAAAVLGLSERHLRTKIKEYMEEQ